MQTNTIIEIADHVFVVDSINQDEDLITFDQSPIPIARLERQAPDFAIPNLTESEAIALDSYKGKWLLIDFWYTGCAPCIQSFPKLKKDVSGFRDDLSILSICRDWERNREKAMSIIENYKLDWDHGLVSPKDDLWKTYGSINDNNQSYPLYLLVDPEGVIVWADNPLRNQELLTEKLNSSLNVK